MLKKMFNCLSLFFIIIFIGTLIITTLNYFSIINNKTISVIKFLIPIIATIISSYRLGKLSEKKGYLEGIKFGGIIVLIFVLLVISLDKLEIKNIIYYGILLLTSIISSTIGINRKKLRA